MKREGTLKIVLAILVIVLLCLISFGGIYKKDKNIMKNILPEYNLGMDLDTTTIIKLDVVKDDDTSSEQEEENNEANTEEENDGQADAEEDKAENQEATENTEDKKDNEQKENKYTVDNYKKCKSIIEKRLKLAEIEQYSVRLNEADGSLVVEVPYSTDMSAIANAFVVGKTEIKIKETEEVIGDNNTISGVTTGIDDSYAAYANLGMGSFVKLDIEFSKDGVNKFKELKNNYVVPTDEQGNKQENNIEISIDGSTICNMEETEFLQSAVNGSLPLKLGGYSTSQSELDKTLTEANSVKTLMETENMPIKYSQAYTSNIHSNINKVGIITVFGIVLAVMLVYLVIRYKLAGLFAELCIAGFLALECLVLRLTNVQISISAIVAIIAITILQFIYLSKILSNQKVTSKVFNKESVKYTLAIIPMFILSAISSVIPALSNVMLIPGNVLEIASFGMVLFWGIIIFEIFNNTITRVILTNAKNK